MKSNIQNVEIAQYPDGMWIAVLLGAPGVWGSGDTPDEAMNELPDVLRGWLEVGGESTWPLSISIDTTAKDESELLAEAAMEPYIEALEAIEADERLTPPGDTE